MLSEYIREGRAIGKGSRETGSFRAELPQQEHLVVSSISAGEFRMITAGRCSKNARLHMSTGQLPDSCFILSFMTSIVKETRNMQI
jgi:hypothetical protein